MKEVPSLEFKVRSRVKTTFRPLFILFSLLPQHQYADLTRQPAVLHNKWTITRVWFRPYRSFG